MSATEPHSATPPATADAVAGAPDSAAPSSAAPSSGAPASGAPASGAPASGVPVSPVPTAVESRRRVPRWIVAVAVATAVASVAAFTTVLLWPVSEGRPLAFHSFTHHGWVPFEETTSTAFTAVAGDRGYTAWERDDDTLGLVAFDIPTGDERWRRTIARDADWRALAATPEELLVVSGHDPRRYSVRDAGTGAERWRLDTDADDRITLTAHSLVWHDREQGVLRGLDRITGELRWQHPLAADERFLHTTAQQTLSRPTYPDGAPTTVDGDDHRLVLVREDRSVAVVHGDDGQVLAEGANVAAPGEFLLAHDDRLYAAPDEDGYQLRSVPLDTPTATPRIHHAAPETDRRPQWLHPCGLDRICVHEEDEDGTAVVAVAAHEAQTHWRVPVSGATRVLPVGEWTVVNRADAEDGPRVTVLDRDGDQRLDRAGEATRLDRGNLLLFDAPLDDASAEIAASGLSVGEEPVSLGRTTDVVPAQCAWNTQYLLCPTDDGADILRFAGD